MRFANLICLIVSVAFVFSASGSIATFDSFEEGYSAYTITDGGITFYDFDWHMPEGDPEPSPPFYIDNVAGSRIENSPFVSRPNVLTAWGWSPTGVFYCRMGELKMTTNAVETFGSLELFSTLQPGETGNTVTLEAIRNGTVVATDAIVMTDPWDQHYTLSISGIEFDTLRLVGTGPWQNGIFPGVLDNVVMTPEPNALALLTLGAVLGLWRRR
jgi:hypothetical protein